MLLFLQNLKAYSGIYLVYRWKLKTWNT